MSKSLLKFVADDLSRACVMVADTQSTIFGLLPFTLTNGSMSHCYNVVNELNDVLFREIGEQVVGDNVAPEIKNERLKILSGDVLLDRIFVSGRVGNVIDIKAEQTEIAIMSMMTRFEEQFFYGDGLNKCFKGLYPRLEEGMGMKFTGTLNMEQLDECLDYVRYSKGEIIMVCNPKTRRAISKLMRTENAITTTVEQFGKAVTQYDGVTIHTSEAVHNGEIFFINLNQSSGVSGLTVDGLRANDQGFEGSMYRIAIEMIVALAVKHPRAFAVLETGSTRKR